MTFPRRNAVVGVLLVVGLVLQLAGAVLRDGPVLGRDLVVAVPGVLVLGAVVLSARGVTLREEPGLRAAGCLLVVVSVLLVLDTAVVLVREEPRAAVSPAECEAARSAHRVGSSAPGLARVRSACASRTPRD